mgnify:CR=1 FL=1
MIKDTLEKVGGKVTLMGHVDRIRDHGKITFIDLRDRSGIIQCVGENLLKITPQSAVEIQGVVNKRPEKMVNADLDTGTVEIWIEEVEVLSQAKAAVRHAAKAAQLQVPLEGLVGQLVLVQALDQQLVAGDALAAADDLAVAFRGQHVGAEGHLRPFRIGLHVEGLDLGGEAVNEDRPIELLGQLGFVRGPEVAAPLERLALLVEQAGQHERGLTASRVDLDGVPQDLLRLVVLAAYREENSPVV